LARFASDRKKQEETIIAKLDYLDQENYQKIIHEWNDTDKVYPDNKTIGKLFEEQAGRSPDSIAVVYDKIQLTYCELNERANQLANYLITHYKIRSDELIALCLDRSEHMLIAILAVLKAGGAYVPMDPSYPDERIGYILNDTNSRIVLTNEVYRSKLEKIRAINFKDSEELKTLRGIELNDDLALSILGIDSQELQEQISLQTKSNPVVLTTSSNLAYVIYTSGTTGNPKGVMQLHGNLMRLFAATEDLYKFSNKDIWILFHSYVFDFSIWEMLGALIHGGKLIILESIDFFETCIIVVPVPLSFLIFSTSQSKK
jgi:non-ribosomal peptide synthetase component F